jgi:hypothetical protein
MYPTAKTIMATPVLFRPGVLAAVRAWKREYRGQRRTPQALEALVHRLATLYKKPVRVVFDKGCPPCYIPGARVMVLQPHFGSIVTTLHEFAHHIFGRSETQACRWSVWLFKRTFPRTFERCTFDGHFVRLGDK